MTTLALGAASAPVLALAPLATAPSAPPGDLVVTLAVIQPLKVTIKPHVSNEGSSANPSLNLLTISANETYDNAIADFRNGTANLTRFDGKHYVEFELLDPSYTIDSCFVGLRPPDSVLTVLADGGFSGLAWCPNAPNGQSRINGALTPQMGAPQTGPVRVGFAISFTDAGARVWLITDLGAGMVWVGGGNPVTDTAPTFIWEGKSGLAPCVSLRNSATVRGHYFAQTHRPVGFLPWQDSERYLSNAAYTSGIDDTPSLQVFTPALLESVAVERRVTCRLWRGRAGISVGNLRLTNYDGYFDAWLTEQWENRAVKIHFVPQFSAIADGFLAATMYAGKPTAPTEDALLIPLTDRAAQLDAPLNPSGEPYIVGAPFSADARLLPTGVFNYLASDSAVSTALVRDSGASVAFTGTAKGFTATLEPAGRIVADLTAPAPSVGAAGTLRGEIVRALTDRLKIPEAEVDTAQLAAFSAGLGAVVAAAYPRTVTGGDAIADIADSVCAWWEWAPNNALSIGRFNLAGAADYMIRDLDIIGDLEISFDAAENSTTRIDAGRNWVPYAENELLAVGGALSLADRVMLQREYRFSATASAAIAPDYYRAQDDTDARAGTLLTTLAQASQLADYVGVALSKRRDFVTLRITAEIAQYANFFPGVTFNVQRDRYGVAAKTLHLIGVTFTDNKVLTLNLWG